MEAAYLYAPLAHKLGLYKLKSELEDLSLKYLEHDAYYHSWSENSWNCLSCAIRIRSLMKTMSSGSKAPDHCLRSPGPGHTAA